MAERIVNYDGLGRQVQTGEYVNWYENGLLKTGKVEKLGAVGATIRTSEKEAVFKLYRILFSLSRPNVTVYQTV